MAVALDVASPQTTFITVATIDADSVTVNSGANRALVGAIFFDAVVTSVTATWDVIGANQAMTQIVTANLDATNGGLYLFGLLNPTAGTSKKITFSWTSTTDGASAGISFTGVDQTAFSSSFVAATTASGTSTTPSITITSAIGNETIDVTYNNAAGYSAPTQTQLILHNGVPVGAGGSSYAAGAATVTHQWTISSSQTWKSIGVNIVAVGGVAADPPRLWLYS